MLTQEITAKLDLLNTKLIDFSENKSLDKIIKLEKKVSQMEAYLERPDFEMFYETEDSSLRNYLRKGNMSEFETKSFSGSAEEHTRQVKEWMDGRSAKKQEILMKK